MFPGQDDVDRMDGYAMTLTVRTPSLTLETGYITGGGITHPFARWFVQHMVVEVDRRLFFSMIRTTEIG